MNRFERVFRIFSTRILHWCGITVLLLVVTLHAQTEKGRTRGAEPIPQPATSAIFAAFDRYEVVAMPAEHGMKDIDDFILSLIRDPRFPGKVNDIEVECGNSLYQAVLDRYIAGEEVPFTEVRKVWRSTTQPMCGYSGFYEQFFPLVRAINQKLPTAKRLRVLAGDPPRDWDKIKTSEEAMNTADREASIVSVMEKEVLSTHRKALMLFGPFHLMHEIDDSAVSTYEKDYPNRTFVISDLGIYDTNRPVASISPFAMWLNPSIALTKGTWLGALSLSDIFPPGVLFDRDCNVHIALPPQLQKQVQKPLEQFIDAFLYLGPQEFRLKEPMPADIALDADYMTKMRRRESLIWGLSGASKSANESNDGIVQASQNPILEGAPPPPDIRAITQSCLDAKKQARPR